MRKGDDFFFFSIYLVMCQNILVYQGRCGARCLPALVLIVALLYCFRFVLLVHFFPPPRISLHEETAAGAKDDRTRHSFVPENIIIVLKLQNPNKMQIDTKIRRGKNGFVKDLDPIFNRNYKWLQFVEAHSYMVPPVTALQPA